MLQNLHSHKPFNYLFQCQEQLDYGISMQLIGVTAEQFDSAASAFTLTAADAVNDHCTTNSSVAMGCCSTNTTLAE